MKLFKLPNTTAVQRVVPKNAFDAYTSTRQKKLFTDLIARITWSHKLSPDTVNLETKEVKEIQIFKVELKIKEDIQPVLDVIDKAIPYNIIFVVEYGNEVYLSTSTKHPHPKKEDQSVIDWTFRSIWFSPDENNYVLHLKKNLDTVYHDFCIQLSNKPSMVNRTLPDLVEYSKQKDLLERDIEQLRKSIKSCKQFKTKVALNLQLKQRMQELKNLIR